jgi:hypothetical protein
MDGGISDLSKDEDRVFGGKKPQISPLRYALSKNILPAANQELWVPHISRSEMWER